jgi:hypothetical protein
MILDEIETVGWSYQKSAPVETATIADWEVLSGTSVTLGTSTIDIDNSLVSAFFNAVEIGITKIKTTVMMSDDRVLIGIVTINVHEC